MSPMLMNLFLWFSKNLFPPVHVLSFDLRDIIAFTNRNNEKISPLKVHLWIFPSAKVFLLLLNFSFQFFMAFVMNFKTLLDILYIFRRLTNQLCRSISLTLLLSSRSMATFFHLFLEMCSSMYSKSCSSAESFLFFGKKSAAYKQTIETLPYLFYCFFYVRVRLIISL